jgi:hypothetical protein
MERVQGSFQGAPYTSRHYGPKAQRVSGTHSGKPDSVTKLRDRLNTVRANSYNELVNMAISQEDCITARQAEKKRKTPVAGPLAQP